MRKTPNVRFRRRLVISRARAPPCNCVSLEDASHVQSPISGVDSEHGADSFTVHADADCLSGHGTWISISMTKRTRETNGTDQADVTDGTWDF